MNEAAIKLMELYAKTGGKVLDRTPEGEEKILVGLRSVRTGQDERRPVRYVDHRS
jgi:hypothetical protein